MKEGMVLQNSSERAAENEDKNNKWRWIERGGGDDGRRKFKLFRRFQSTNYIFATANVQIDWKEMLEFHVFKVELQGLKKEKVKVEVEEGRVLQINSDRARGISLRRFYSRKNVKNGEVKATMENGVLTVTVPKLEMKKSKAETNEINS
ncbi:17.8 kDa class I heat shock protein-like [Olea europaea var. sylvestris]|uniref:17.8 kDa class I heat shock protein-like n=1 Tax=Olea europaea var. sylvestris TaxID=158386 RepID=UPI000C1D1169|nr:17.8 kDa class I heat shock protein-like [Olea europaea var. sylvestris]